MRDGPPGYSRTTNLVDVLDRVLEKGLVIAGDVKISLAEVELLTIKRIRIVSSSTSAREIFTSPAITSPFSSTRSRTSTRFVVREYPGGPSRIVSFKAIAESPPTQ